MNVMRSTFPAVRTPALRAVLHRPHLSSRRSYAGIKQDDPSLHPTGANSEAAKSYGPLKDSQPSSQSNQVKQSKKSTESVNERNAAVKEPQQRQQEQQQPTQSNGQQQPSTSTTTAKARTVAEEDEELRQRMSGYAGDGGEAGVEYENGQPVAMKRGVKNNMFRYI